jgi:hypothetical protein
MSVKKISVRIIKGKKVVDMVLEQDYGFGPYIHKRLCKVPNTAAEEWAVHAANDFIVKKYGKDYWVDNDLQQETYKVKRKFFRRALPIFEKVFL